MFNELGTVVLTRDVEEHGLRKGDVGAIVHAYANADAYEVEFLTADGTTISVETLSGSDIRAMTGHEILNVRQVA